MQINDRQLKGLAWGIAGAASAMMLLSAVFVYLNPGPPFPYWGSGWGFGVLYPVVGAVIISRMPRHRVAWLLMAGAAWAFESLVAAFGLYQLYLNPVSRVAAWCIWFALWFWIVGAVSATIVLYVFPTGYPLTPRWRWGMWAVVAGFTLQAISVAFYPGLPRSFPLGFTFHNPAGIENAQSLLGGLDFVSGPLMVLFTLAGALSLLVRLKRAHGVERQQVKWFAFAGAVSMVLLVAGNELIYVTQNLWGPGVNSIFALVYSTFASALMPIAAGLAILRYRLYEIDIIIRRTLIYGAVTITLAVIYYLSVLLLEQLLHLLTGQQQSDVVVVISTLAIAALFAPLRRRIQAVIDRRFYRRKYDAAQVLAAYGATLRNEVDLQRLTGELLNVVEQTMQPSKISLWLNEAESKK